MKRFFSAAYTCDYCTRLAQFRGRGFPPGGWLPRWVKWLMATEHRSCHVPDHFVAAAGAIQRAQRR